MSKGSPKKFLEQFVDFCLYGDNLKENYAKWSKIDQILEKSYIFEVGQLFLKNNFLIRIIISKVSPKCFSEVFDNFRPFYGLIFGGHIFHKF